LSAELALHGLPLRAEKVTAGYGGDPVIRDITVSADPGEVVSLVGPNGSGKSTLLKSLVGVVRLSSGTVKVGDRDLTNSAPEEVARAAVGYVPQVDDVFSPLTVRENLEMGGYLLRRAQVAERVERVLAIFPRLGGMLGRSAGKLSGSCSTRACSCSMSRPRTSLLSWPPHCSPSTSASWRPAGRRC
jgi:ABC-type branched-subunit amino acid transport system ATPase component